MTAIYPPNLGLNDQTDYNGWSNRQTWSVALNINNDYYLYTAAVEFMKTYKRNQPYRAFVAFLGIQDDKTTEGYKFRSNKLNYTQLNAMMREML